MKKSAVAVLCALSAIAGAAYGPIVREHFCREPTQISQDSQHQNIANGSVVKGYLEKGNEIVFIYDSGSRQSHNIKIRYCGAINETGDLELYIRGKLCVAKVGKPIELVDFVDSGQKIELTPLETIAKGVDKGGIMYFMFSAPPGKIDTI